MNNKKTIIILILVLTIGIVGLTIAYFSNSTSIDNLFSTNPYGTTVVEEFISPDNWLPGTTTEKTITVTNTGSVDEAVRISYTEEWKAKDGTILSGLIDSNGILTNNTENSERAAIINFSDNNDWNYSNGYYYYNYRLAPQETTSSLIDSVTFNSKVKNSSNCTTTENNGTKTITCNSTNSGYDGATYTLTFTIETVQYDKYMSAWGTDVAILEEQALFCDAFDVGEVVEYNNAEYYVLKDSSTSDDYVTLLKKDPLTASEVNQYSNSYVSQDGEYPYYESDTCNELTQTGCSTNYDTSDVKKIVDGWSSSFSDDLVSVDGYNARLVNYDDLFNSLNYIEDIGPSWDDFRATSDTPKWAYIDGKRYWSLMKVDDSDNQLFNVGMYLLDEPIYSKFYIRPVINLKKSSINGACYSSLVNEYFACEFGDEVTYNNELYYVLDNSDSNKKSVTLLKKEPLTAEVVNKYSTSYVSQDGEYPFYDTESCNENTQYGCGVYDTSNVKKIIDGWSSSFKYDLYYIGDYRARLINSEELFDKLYYEYRINISDSIYNVTDETPEWSHVIGKPYWTMVNYVHTNSEAYCIQDYYAESKNVYNRMYIRPVINLHKKAIEKGCNKPENISITYNMGETIEYNNENYCVIAKSNQTKDYVTLIKKEPLTYNELTTYNNGYEIYRDNEYNDTGIMSYYKSDTCYYNSDSDNNTIGCSINYDTSNVKMVVNNWSNTFNNDLKEINGYKSRLITMKELNKMGHLIKSETINTSGVPHKYLEKSEYDCLYGNANYWTMNSLDYLSGWNSIVSLVESRPVYEKYAVRPVINLKKCALTNTCE